MNRDETRRGQEGFPREKLEMGLEGCIGVSQVVEEAVCTKEQSVE